MATLAVMDNPRPPISLVWADFVRDYESLGDVGVDLEFVIESEYLTPDEPRPVFSDRDGRRFRILVMSLEVVLCIVVPEDFEPEQLTIQSVRRDDEELIVESLNGRPHRALSTASGRALPIGGMTSALTETASSLAYSGGSPTWLDFDRAWLESVDPAPPISPLHWARDRIFRLFRTSR